jgi:hypothetical protein
MELLVLAKPDKKCKDQTKGFCIAGVTENGQWVRLVSNPNGDSVRANECRSFDTGNSIYIDDKNIFHYPLVYQPENFYVNDFRCIHVLSKQVTLPSVSKDSYIFLNNNHFLRASEIPHVGKSLVLAEVTDLIIYKNEYEKIKARFMHNNKLYEEMSITDPRFYAEKSIKKAHVVVSLPQEPYNELYYYKFVAAIYPF